MLKVKLVPMTLMVPVIDNSGDHDCKMDEQRYAAMNSLLTNLLEYVSTTETVRQGVSQNAGQMIPMTEEQFREFSKHPMSTEIPSPVPHAARKTGIVCWDEKIYDPTKAMPPRASEVLRDAGNLVYQNLSFARQNAKPHVWEISASGTMPFPVSQIDPPIDTTVRDSEMRSTAPEMTLEELRERPERTKTPPRPRANSWRHE